MAAGGTARPGLLQVLLGRCALSAVLGLCLVGTLEDTVRRRTYTGHLRWTNGTGGCCRGQVRREPREDAATAPDRTAHLSQDRRRIAPTRPGCRTRCRST